MVAMMPVVVAPVVMVPVMPVVVVPMMMVPVVVAPVVVAVPADLFRFEAIDLVLSYDGWFRAVHARRQQALSK
jgi:hypothetical protein